MLLVVTIVGLCVQVYSLSYMRDDERIGWYYAVLSLFTAAMLIVVLADNFLELYMAWEVMGLCSYLLIGFWHQEEGPRKASIKAFLVTRVGDVGFALGLALMYQTCGSFAYDVVLPAAVTWAPGVATAMALLLLFGAMGKSAQFPLHVWLPDAMAGPTPASALIHAATMVAAGVFLVIVSMPIFVASKTALTVTLVIGLITALLGGLLGMVQYDIKKVLAYSTISQLGFMFIALGAGGATQALWHLTTHAFFKSLLFLGAGSIIHATHTQDMREMGGLARKMPWTTAVFTIGTLALAGVFPLSGFFSKDEILLALQHSHNTLAFGLTLLAAAMTAFYMTRLCVRVFLGEPAHAHESDALMLSPMVLLAAITAVIGLLTPAAFVFLGHEGEWPTLAMFATSTAVTAAGFGVGWYVYGMRRVDTERVRERLGFVYVALREKLYMDAVYDAVFVRPYAVLCDGLDAIDGTVIDGAVNGAAMLWRRVSTRGRSFDIAVIDGLVNGVAAFVVAAGSRLRRLQTGRVQSYQKLILGALLLLMLFMVLSKGA
jgi:NADH-quinone oxidoreductase subunit L